jgi:hypothetical protein
MPPKRQAIDLLDQARVKRNRRALETEEQREARLLANRERIAQERLSETVEQREARLKGNRERNAQTRLSETLEEREGRLEIDRKRTAEARMSETIAEREGRLEIDRKRTAEARMSETIEEREGRLQRDRINTAFSRTFLTNLQNCAFHYNANYDYSRNASVFIGKMDQVCVYCRALKFKNESPGMCCASGKVKLPEHHPRGGR